MVGLRGELGTVSERRFTTTTFNKNLEGDWNHLQRKQRNKSFEIEKSESVYLLGRDESVVSEGDIVFRPRWPLIRWFQLLTTTHFTSHLEHSSTDSCIIQLFFLFKKNKTNLRWQCSTGGHIICLLNPDSVLYPYVHRRQNGQVYPVPSTELLWSFSISITNLVYH